MNNPLNPLMYKEWPLKSRLWTTAGSYRVLLEPGSYTLTIHGAGGAGGSTSTAPYSGGVGGAGGVGQLVTETISIDTAEIATIYVGAGGLTYNNGGNGGGSDGNPAGGGKYQQNYIGGFGGGGGYPTYIKIGNTFYIALGGGGGGGGGASARYGRYGQAGSGGGGGGFYRIDATTGVITSVPGQLGSRGGGQDDGAGQAGRTGNTTDFPTLQSGQGGRGGYSEEARGRGGASAYGGGASGGGGGGGAGNHSSAYGGGGGGGAGGCADAGGGKCGTGMQRYGAATDGSNPHTVPTPTVNYMGQAVSTGWGVGGTTDTNGSAGWAYIVQTSRKAVPNIVDQGLLSDPTITTVDNGELDDGTITTTDNGEL